MLFWTGLLVSFWTGELLPMLLMFIASTPRTVGLPRPTPHTLKPGDSIAAAIDVLAAVDTELIDATFATASRHKAVLKNILTICWKKI
jgi:hypothetical protein